MVVVALCLGVLYLLFAGDLSLHELLAGVVACGLAVTFAAVARRAAERRYACVFPAAALGKVAGSLVLDSLRVGAVLWQVLRRRPAAAVGSLRRQPFRHGGQGPHEAGRRAFVTAAKSLAPNEFVVDVPETGNWLAVHSLANAPGSEDREWPI